MKDGFGAGIFRCYLLGGQCSNLGLVIYLLAFLADLLERGLFISLSSPCELDRYMEFSDLEIVPYVKI